MVKRTFSDKETRQFGREVASMMKGGEVLCLYGELGAGKTTFTKGFIGYFLPKKRVLSPTYIIVRHYPTVKGRVKNIFHVDLYRLENTQEIEGMGLFEIINNKNNIVLIEWAERMGNHKPKNRIDMFFSIINENRREITTTSYG